MTEPRKTSTQGPLLAGFGSIILIFAVFAMISTIEIRALSKLTRTISQSVLHIVVQVTWILANVCRRIVVLGGSQPS